MRDKKQSQRRLLLWAVLALWSGIGILHWAFYLKAQEMLAYRDETLRIRLYVVGGALLWVGWMLLIDTLLRHLWKQKGWGNTIKGPYANHFGAAFAVLFAPLVMYATYYAAEHVKKLELGALRARGRWITVRIDDVHYVAGKSRDYSCSFVAKDIWGRIPRLDVRRPSANDLAEGDSVRIFMLPANPTIFREYDPNQEGK